MFFFIIHFNINLSNTNYKYIYYKLLLSRYICNVCKIYIEMLLFKSSYNPMTFYRIQNAISGDPIFSLTLMQVIFSPLQGK